MNTSEHLQVLNVFGKNAADYFRVFSDHNYVEKYDFSRVMSTAKQICIVDNLTHLDAARAFIEACFYEISIDNEFNELKNCIILGGYDRNKHIIERMQKVGVSVPNDIIQLKR